MFNHTLGTGSKLTCVRRSGDAMDLRQIYGMSYRLCRLTSFLINVLHNRINENMENITGSW